MRVLAARAMMAAGRGQKLVMAAVGRKRVLLRDMAFYGALFVGAEAMQQTITKKIRKTDEDPHYDLGALARYTVYGVFVYPPIYHKWYRWLDARFVGVAPVTILKKVLLDQFLLEPPLLLFFFLGMSAMEGSEEVTREAREKFLPTFAVGCLFWMPAMAANFFFLPTSMRVMFIGVCQFTWCNFLCWMKKTDINTLKPATNTQSLSLDTKLSNVSTEPPPLDAPAPVKTTPSL